GGVPSFAIRASFVRYNAIAVRMRNQDDCGGQLPENPEKPMAKPRTFTFLGTGTSVGVPMIGCDCDTCRSNNPRNHRFRCAILVATPEGNILVDTPPELRLQLLRERVGIIHALLYTHYHADHLFGFDDVRPMQKYLGGPLPIYCTEEVEDKIREVFSYAF